MTRVAFPAKTTSKVVANLLSGRGSGNLNPLAPSPRSISRSRACWGFSPGRVRYDAENVHGPGLEPQHEQHVQALQQNIDV